MSIKIKIRKNGKLNLKTCLQNFKSRQNHVFHGDIFSLGVVHKDEHAPKKKKKTERGCINIHITTMSSTLMISK